MTTGHPAPKQRPRAADVCEHCQPGPTARGLLRADSTAAAYLDTLEAAGLYEDAIRFCAYWLPGREAVWWGCLCLWSCCRPTPTPAEAAAFQAVVRWLREPGEDNRRKVEAAASQAEASTVGSLAQAAAWAEGSMAPPGLPAVPPPPHLYARTLAAALQAAARGDPNETTDRCRRFLALARQVADGAYHWDTRATRP